MPKCYCRNYNDLFTNLSPKGIKSWKNKQNSKYYSEKEISLYLSKHLLMIMFQFYSAGITLLPSTRQNSVKALVKFWWLGIRRQVSQPFLFTVTQFLVFRFIHSYPVPSLVEEHILEFSENSFVLYIKENGTV